MTGRSSILDGIRVVDLTQMLAGPYCTMILADLGADVIKVEPPSGDMVREVGPFAPGDDQHHFGGYFQSINRNKRGIAIDLKAPGGRDALLALADSADVLVENYRHGVMERLDLSYETLATSNPRLVYAAIRGFGDDRTGASPYRDWPAFDVVSQAMGGLVGITGPADQPSKAGPGIGDMFPAALAVIGILAALREAERTGSGRFVDVAMSDAVLALCERIVYQHSYTGVVPGPEGNGHPMLSPFDIFPARDGWIAIAAHRDHFWVRLCELIGQPELAEDAGFLTNEDRVRNRADVDKAISEWTEARTRSEITDTLGGIVPCGPVHDASTARSDPHFRARGMLIDLPQPGTNETFEVVGNAIKFDRGAETEFVRAPLLGEHSDRILEEVGYSAARLAALRASGALGAAGADRER